ncbi:dihydrofolate reductase family protein [Georgenia sp. SYP-B2076]|uniref:dihydrofolate reductase family protein n=1 Tax=Georgenia sp. SYP-B2076 TaxID=2495881 RepID=UPI000F8E6CC0|nr:dihydrofolate reductase family protein [Georgenia sp. SYP-B2076]
MARVIYNAAATLNGFIADDEDSLSWLFAVESAGAPDNAAFLRGIGALVMGSTTYEWVLREERILERPGRWQELEYVGGRPAFVFTTRRLPTPEGADVRLVRGAVADRLPDLAAAAGDRDLWLLGGGDLAGQFLDVDALDEIQVSVAPATLPGGAALLPRRVGPDRLALTSAERHGQFVHLVYAVQRPAGG